jgi:hypothetical protein
MNAQRSEVIVQNPDFGTKYKVLNLKSGIKYLVSIIPER